MRCRVTLFLPMKDNYCRAWLVLALAASCLVADVVFAQPRPSAAAAKRPAPATKKRPSAKVNPRSDALKKAPVAPPPVGELPQDPNRIDMVQTLGNVRPRFQECFEHWQVPGALLLKLTIASSGHVTNVAVEGELAGTPSADCVEKIASAAEFPRFKRDKITLTYPVLLKASE